MIQHQIHVGQLDPGQQLFERVHQACRFSGSEVHVQVRMLGDHLPTACLSKWRSFLSGHAEAQGSA